MSRVWCVACAVGPLCGCTYYDSALVGGVSPADSGIEADSTTGTCSRALPPEPPAVKDAAGSIELVLAVRTIDFHETTQFNTIGYDLDKTCTCLGEGNSCQPPANSTPQDQCDGPGGRDNRAAALIAASSMLGLSSATFDNDIADGEWSILVRVRGYNGLADDDQVSVAWLVPLNFMKPPVWDGTDAWGINGSCLNHDGTGKPDLESPLITDTLAYVTGGRLVASLKGGASLTLSTGMSIIINDAFLVAGLVQDGSKWSVQEGLLVGVWKTTDLLANLRYTTVGGQPLCATNGIYKNIKDSVCQKRDILASGGAPTAPCDAISLAFTFTAAPAKIALALDNPAGADPCPSDTDAAAYECD
ncbi:MAG: hypothetical protein HY898_31395 [Deltaproteobacteria bacterium]|nr:hypothetical protein [Deltaproteobacteria bacterium]